MDFRKNKSRTLWTLGTFFFVMLTALYAYGCWKDRVFATLADSRLYLSFHRPYEHFLVSRLPPRTPDFVYRRIVRPIDSLLAEPKTAFFGGMSRHDQEKYDLCGGFLFWNLESVEAKPSAQVPNALTNIGKLPNCQTLRFVGQDSFPESNFKATAEKLPKLENVILCATDIQWETAHQLQALPIKRLYTETVHYDDKEDFAVTTPLPRKDVKSLTTAFPNLEELYLSVSDSSALQELNKLPRLRTLSLAFRHSSIDLIIGADTAFPKLAWTTALYMPQTFGTPSPDYFSTAPFLKITKLGMVNVEISTEHADAIRHTFPAVDHILIKGGKIHPRAIQILLEADQYSKVELYGTEIDIESNPERSLVPTTLLIRKKSNNASSVSINGNGYSRQSLTASSDWNSILQEACDQLKPDPY